MHLPDWRALIRAFPITAPEQDVVSLVVSRVNELVMFPFPLASLLTTGGYSSSSVSGAVSWLRNSMWQ